MNHIMSKKVGKNVAKISFNVKLDTENAYIMACRQILPVGLLGLMLTGMYFSTSASANTTLNVVSAVFTNDIYKGAINPNASEKKLMSVARTSSWCFGIFMILIALAVPYLGGVVEFTISLGAITGGPLLLPPIWALFSKRLTGKATINITLVSLAVNIFFKLILPAINGYKLSRGSEMLLGVLLPLILLLIYDFIFARKQSTSEDYQLYLNYKSEKKVVAMQMDAKEMAIIRTQNKFGLRMIAFSLLFTGLLLLVLSLITPHSKGLVLVIAILIMIGAIIP
ncbi:hypothetical protein PIECOFPK_02160 [Mycovorax composti]|uniref:Sodium:solute symporter n=1 Tax=Mycovorax composti TaxID=2962693 RepID=A0ABZ2EMD4_9BACT